MFSLDSYSSAASKSSKEPSGQAVAQILASLSSATIDVPRNYAVDFSTTTTSSSISIPTGLSSTSSCEEYTPSLSSSVSSISSLSSLRLSADSSPVLDTAAQRLAFLPLPQHSSQPTGDHKGLAAELQQQMLAVQRGSSPRRIPARASMHRRHSASCSSSSSSSAPLSTSLPSSSVLAAKTNSAGRVSKSASLSGCSLPAYQSTVASLVKHAGKRGSFVSSLVDSATLMIESIWPSARDAPPTSDPATQILPLRTFIEETLRRSRTSYSTLQVALYYLCLLRPHVQDPSKLRGNMGALNCGRRAFLTSLMLASKYLQDKNYSARAWSKISGLSTAEINANEMAFLVAVEWRIHVPEDVYERWSNVLLSSTCMVGNWKRSQSLVDAGSTVRSARNNSVVKGGCGDAASAYVSRYAVEEEVRC